MFGQKKRGPSRPTGPFDHAYGCAIVRADPGFQPEWQEIDEGHWQRACQCWTEDIYEPRVDTRPRLDPYDRATFRHLGACEHRDVTDPVFIKAILTVTERENYWYVQCRTCDGGWQTPFYAEESVG